MQTDFTSRPRPLDRVGGELAEWASGTMSRVPTGYSVFDSRTNGGVASGEMAVMLARSGVGKTFFALNVALHNPTTPTLFLSFEMHARYLLSRLAAMDSDTSTDYIEKTIQATGTSPEVRNLVGRLPLLMIDDVPGQDAVNMLDSVEMYELAMGERPKLVLLDYMELVRPMEADSNGTGTPVDTIAWNLKEFAREADVALIVLHQVKRGESRREKPPGGGPMQSVPNLGQYPVTTADARYGGEMQADYVWSMYRPGLHPWLTDSDKKALETDVRFQFLKTRGAGGTQPLGVQHLLTPRNGRIDELRLGEQVIENVGALSYRRAQIDEREEAPF